MFSFKVGYVTVDFTPLVIAFFVAIVGGILYKFFLSKRNKKLAELCCKGEYSDLIVLAEKQLNHYQFPLRIKKKHTKFMIETIHLFLAISYFALSNDELFIHNMTQVADNNPEKHFWLALFYLLKKDLINFQAQYDILSSKCINENYLLYLTSIEKLQEGDDADARIVLSSLKPKLNYKLLQDISQKIINQ